jgi:hypothetical protein
MPTEQDKLQRCRCVHYQREIPKLAPNFGQFPDSDLHKLSAATFSQVTVQQCTRKTNGCLQLQWPQNTCLITSTHTVCGCGTPPRGDQTIEVHNRQSAQCTDHTTQSMMHRASRRGMHHACVTTVCHCYCISQRDAHSSSSSSRATCLPHVLLRSVQLKQTHGCNRADENTPPQAATRMLALRQGRDLT